MKLVVLFFATLMIGINISIKSQTIRQSENKFEKQITITLPANYLLYLPVDYNQSEKNFPLVLFHEVRQVFHLL